MFRGKRRPPPQQQHTLIDRTNTQQQQKSRKKQNASSRIENEKKTGQHDHHLAASTNRVIRHTGKSTKISVCGGMYLYVYVCLSLTRPLSSEAPRVARAVSAPRRGALWQARSSCPPSAAAQSPGHLPTALKSNGEGACVKVKPKGDATAVVGAVIARGDERKYRSQGLR